MKQIEIKQELITPQMASEYLKKNVNNRSKKDIYIKRYAKDMAEGRWKNNTYEPIKFATSGRLLDGQNRLYAVVLSECPIEFTVITNLDEEIFDVLDTGAKRIASDVFGIKKISRPNSLPSMIQSYINLSERKDNRRGGASSKNLTNTQLLEFYEVDPEHWDYVCRESYLWYSAFAKILPPSLIGGLFALFLDINKKDAIDFMSQMCTGIDVKNKMVSLLRTKLMQDKMANRKIPHIDKIALILKTWNYYRSGKELLFLKFDTEREPFPTII